MSLTRKLAEKKTISLGQGTRLDLRTDGTAALVFF